MSEPVTFTSNDLLDSLMRAAMQPSVDANGHPVYNPLSSITSTVSQQMGQQGPFRDALLAALTERIDAIADGVVGKVPETIFTKRYPTFGRDEPEYHISSWVKEPLTAALAEALKPAMERYVNENFPTMELDSITVNVTVKPK